MSYNVNVTVYYLDYEMGWYYSDYGYGVFTVEPAAPPPPTITGGPDDVVV